MARKRGTQIWRIEKNGKLMRLVTLKTQNINALGERVKNEGEVLELIASALTRDSAKEKWKDFTKILGLAQSSITIQRNYERIVGLFKAMRKRDNAMETMHYLLEGDYKGEKTKGIIETSESSIIRKTPPFSRFGSSEMYPSFAEGMYIGNVPGCGRGVLAERSFAVGEKVVFAQPYAWAAENAEDLPYYCLTCGKEDAAFLPCTECPDVFFCSLKCQLANKIHKYECGTTFHTDKEISVHHKCIVNMILEGAEAYDWDIKEMQQETLEKIEQQPAVPSSCIEPKDRYLCVVALTVNYPIYLNHQIQTVYDMMMHLPQVEDRFKSNKHFLQHLIGHFVGVEQGNSFSRILKTVRNYVMIYDAFSYFNHSCSPNVGIVFNGKYLLVSFYRSNRTI